MDSTLVGQVTRMASQLGIEARTAFVWWLVARLAVHFLWALVVMFVFWRVSGLFSKVVKGHELICAVKGDTYSITNEDFLEAKRVLLEHFHSQHPQRGR